MLGAHARLGACACLGAPTRLGARIMLGVHVMLGVRAIVGRVRYVGCTRYVWERMLLWERTLCWVRTLCRVCTLCWVRALCWVRGGLPRVCLGLRPECKSPISQAPTHRIATACALTPRPDSTQGSLVPRKPTSLPSLRARASPSCVPRATAVSLHTSQQWPTHGSRSCQMPTTSVPKLIFVQALLR